MVENDKNIVLLAINTSITKQKHYFSTVKLCFGNAKA